MRNSLLKYVGLLCALLFGIGTSVGQNTNADQKVVVAYIISWSDFDADPYAMTHINFAFGEVNSTHNGINFSGGNVWNKVKALKNTNPNLKLMLSIGGANSTGWDVMVLNESNRNAFAEDCLRVCNEYGFDGIDIDWEYPYGEAQTNAYTEMMKAIRNKLGPNRYLTLATANWGDGIDFQGILPYIDFVNIMSYDLGNGSTHNAALYSSSMAGWGTVDAGVAMHMSKGVPANKLVVGLPFYGRGTGKYVNGNDNSIKYKDISASDLANRRWDDAAKVPYLDVNGSHLSYDDGQSIGIKCDYIKEKGLRGAMYWEISGDKNRELQTIVKNKVLDGSTVGGGTTDPSTPSEPDQPTEVDNNLAIGKPAWATSSHYETQRNQYNGQCLVGAASFVNDKSLTTRWGSAWAANNWNGNTAEAGSADPQDIIIDLQKPYYLSKVVLHWDGTYAAQYVLQYSNDANGTSTLVGDDVAGGAWEGLTVNPKKWTVKVDENTWQQVPGSPTGVQADALDQTIDNISGVTARFIRVRCTQRIKVDGTNECGYSIKEIEVYGDEHKTTIPETAKNIAPLGVASCSTHHDENNPNEYNGYSYVGPANYVNDERMDTRWASGWEANDSHQADAGSGSNIPEWVMVDLKKAYDLSNVIIKWDGVYAADYQLQVSNSTNASNPKWETVQYVNGWNPGDNLTAEYGFAAPKTARFVRVYCTKRGVSGYAYSIKELEIYGEEHEGEISDDTIYVPDRPTGSNSSKVVVAYVTSWSSITPDPTAMTHINYAFGHVTDSYNGVRIDNESRLRNIVSLKNQNPNLKIMLSVGGWGSGRFSEMAADENYRKSFSAACKSVCDQYGLDGIDIDWEFPTSSSAGISSSPADRDNYTLLMRDLRAALGNDKQLTIATCCKDENVNFRAFVQYVDFVNIMAYDMASAPQHNAALFRSNIAGYCTSAEAIDWHLNQGVPADKLVLGLAFYGHGASPYDNFVDYKNVTVKPGCTEMWDDVAKVPYIVNSNGTMVLGYDNPRSLALKCDYALQTKGLLGCMYWDYDGDNAAGDLRRTVKEHVIDAYPGTSDDDEEGVVRLGNIATLGDAWCSSAHEEHPSGADNRDCGGAAYVNDDRDSTRWQSGWEAITDSSQGWVHPADDGSGSDIPEWVAIDLKKSYDIVGIDVVWQDAYAKDYLLQTAPEDGAPVGSLNAPMRAPATNPEAWTTVENVSGWDGTPSLTRMRDFETPHAARYVRVYCTKRGFTGYGYSIIEIKVYGKESPEHVESAVLHVKDGKPVVSVTKGAIECPGYEGPISVYSMDGRVVYMGTATRIEIPAGLYIVRMGDDSTKVMVR